MNYVYVNDTLVGGKNNAYGEVLYISPPTMTVLRYAPETIYARDGYRVDTDGAYEGYDGQVKILTNNQADREKIIQLFNTRERNIKFKGNMLQYYQNGKVEQHVIEQVSPKSWLHHITIKYQPFFIDIAPMTYGNPSRITYKGQASVYPKITIDTGSAQSTITINQISMTVDASSKVIIDGENFEILDANGWSAPRKLISGSFPRLDVGENGIMTNGISSYTITYQERHLLIPFRE